MSVYLGKLCSVEWKNHIVVSCKMPNKISHSSKIFIPYAAYCNSSNFTIFGTSTKSQCEIYIWLSTENCIYCDLLKKIAFCETKEPWNSILTAHARYEPLQYHYQSFVVNTTQPFWPLIMTSTGTADNVATCRSLVSRERTAVGWQLIGISCRWDRRFLFDFNLRERCAVLWT